MNRVDYCYYCLSSFKKMGYSEIQDQNYNYTVCFQHFYVSMPLSPLYQCPYKLGLNGYIGVTKGLVDRSGAMSPNICEAMYFNSF